jgi:nucleoside 2-deoxyribosyltransferase
MQKTNTSSLDGLLANFIINQGEIRMAIKAYLANGLFSEADQAFNTYLADRLRQNFPWIDLYVPQENEALNDKTGYAASKTIFWGDNEHLDNADLLIAVLDGVEIDAGVAAEIGRFAALREMEIKNNNATHRYIYGLYTDVRQQGVENAKKIDALVNEVAENQFMYRNLYVTGAVKANGIIVGSSDDLIKEMDKLPFKK